jgi:hypothetical protein
VFAHHVEMHEFWLWCDSKSLKKICEKVLKNNCENWCKSLNLKMLEKLFKRFSKSLKIVGEICVKIGI